MIINDVFCPCLELLSESAVTREVVTLTGFGHCPDLAGEVSRVFRSWSETSQVGRVHLELVYRSLCQTLHLPASN